MTIAYTTPEAAFITTEQVLTFHYISTDLRHEKLFSILNAMHKII